MIPFLPRRLMMASNAITSFKNHSFKTHKFFGINFFGHFSSLNYFIFFVTHHRLLSIGFYFLNGTIYVNFHKAGDLALNGEYQIFVVVYQASYLLRISISL